MKHNLLVCTGSASKSFSITGATCGTVNVGVEEIETGGGGASNPTGVIYVDRYKAPPVLADQKGTIDAPFERIQEAVDLGRANMTAAAGDARNIAIILIAPAEYHDDIVIPAPPNDADLPVGNYCLQAWCESSSRMAVALPRLSGTIFVTPRTLDGEPSQVALTSLALTGSMKSTLPTTGRMYVHVRNCWDVENYEAGILQISWEDTTRGFGDIIGHLVLNMTSDSSTWGQGLYLNSPIAFEKTRNFFDTGVDQGNITLNVLALAIGQSRLVTLSYPRADLGDFALWGSYTSPGDYTMVFVGSNPGELVFRITNISRASTNFTDDGWVMCFHQLQPGDPVPPPAL